MESGETQQFGLAQCQTVGGLVQYVLPYVLYKTAQQRTHIHVVISVQLAQSV
jgi:hypothetical protein